MTREGAYGRVGDRLGVLLTVACKIVCTPGSKWLPTIATRRAKCTISDISATSLSSATWTAIITDTDKHFVTPTSGVLFRIRGLETWHSALRGGFGAHGATGPHVDRVA